MFFPQFTLSVTNIFLLYYPRVGFLGQPKNHKINQCEDKKYRGQTAGIKGQASHPEESQQSENNLGGYEAVKGSHR